MGRYERCFSVPVVRKIEDNRLVLNYASMEFLRIMPNLLTDNFSSKV